MKKILILVRVRELVVKNPEDFIKKLNIMPLKTSKTFSNKFGTKAEA